MGFPSPAKDYAERALFPEAERALFPEVLCGATAKSRIFETDSGYAVIDSATSKPKEGVLLILCDGCTQFAKLIEASLITHF